MKGMVFVIILRLTLGIDVIARMIMHSHNPATALMQGSSNRLLLRQGKTDLQVGKKMSERFSVDVMTKVVL